MNLKILIVTYFCFCLFHWSYCQEADKSFISDGSVFCTIIESDRITEFTFGIVESIDEKKISLLAQGKITINNEIKAKVLVDSSFNLPFNEVVKIDSILSTKLFYLNYAEKLWSYSDSVYQNGKYDILSNYVILKYLLSEIDSNSFSERIEILSHHKENPDFFASKAELYQKLSKCGKAFLYSQLYFLRAEKTHDDWNSTVEIINASIIGCKFNGTLLPLIDENYSLKTLLSQIRAKLLFSKDEYVFRF